MRKKVITVALAPMLSLNASIGLAATHSSRSSSVPTTTPRSGTFSKGGSSSSSHVTTPSQSSSSGFSGGSSSTTAPSSSSSVNSSSSSGFSGGASNKSAVPSTPSSSNTVTKDGTTYSTGNQRPSTNLQNGSTMNPNTGSYYGGSTHYDTVPSDQKPSSFWPMAGAFAAGTFLGSMLHPMGGYYLAAAGGYVH